MKNYIVLTLVFVLCSSFSNGQQANKNIPFKKSFFDEGYFIDRKLLNKHQHSSEINFLKTGIVIFFNDGNVMYCNLGIKDTDSLNFINITKRIIIKDFYGISWGKYKIENNVIKAEFWFQFFTSGLKLKYYKTYFEGILTDTNTITNWKMVTPYPKTNKRLNENFETLKIEKDLNFVPNQGTKIIDSKKAWIN